MLLLLVASPAHADDLKLVESDFLRLNRAEHRLMISPLTDGALSCAITSPQTLPIF